MTHFGTDQRRLPPLQTARADFPHPACPRTLCSEACADRRRLDRRTETLPRIEVGRGRPPGSRFAPVDPSWRVGPEPASIRRGQRPLFSRIGASRRRVPREPLEREKTLDTRSFTRVDLSW
jgi:hypothetical protein